MRPVPTRAAAAVGLVAVALFGTGCGGSSPSQTASPPGATAANGPASSSPSTVPSGTQTIAVTVTGGQPQGGVRHVHVPLGTPVEVTVKADVSDEVHVHGFDLHADVSPDQPATLTFTADQPGNFEVELEQHASTLVVLEIGA